MTDRANYNVLRVFIASPGDLGEERQLFPSILEDVNRISAHGKGIHLEPLGWEDTLPGMGRPQALINEDVKRCDLFVMLLWRRWGTPSGEYSSGSEEEFELARKLHEDQDKPKDIWLFFKDVSEEMMADPGAQLSKVLDFRKGIEAGRVCLYRKFQAPSDFRAILIDCLCQWIDQGERLLCPTPSAQVLNRYREQMEELQKQLDGERAARESAQSLLRTTALQLGRRAVKAAREGRPTEAEQDFSASLQTYPLPFIMTSYGTFLFDQGNMPAAEQMYRRSLKNDPSDHWTWLCLADTLGELKRPTEAEQAYRAAIKLAPSDSYALTSLGMFYEDADRLQEAEKEYRLAVQVNQQDAFSWSRLGGLLENTGRIVEAEEAYRHCIAADDQYAHGWNNLGSLLEKTKRLEEAQEAYETATRVDPDYAYAWCNLGHLLETMKQADQAEEAYRKATKVDPRYAYCWVLLGRLLQKQGRLKESEQAFRKAVKVDSRYEYAWSLLGDLMQETGRPAEAITAYEEALDLKPDNQSTREKLRDIQDKMATAQNANS